jgi:tRNA threonylcarbamoyladenosine biosynthesis protein TsaB
LPSDGRDAAQILIVAIDSKREEIFLRRDGDAPLIAHPRAALAGWPDGRYALAGDAAPQLAAAFAAAGRQDQCVVLASAPPRASAFGRILAQQGVEFWRQRNAQDGLPKPLYLRPPDVTMGTHKPLAAS